MPWIELVGEDDADGILGRAYETAKRHYGRVPNILRALSPRPKALQKHTPLFREIMFADSALPRLERELLAVVVSTTNGCTYCTTTHGYAMVAEGADHEFVSTIQEDPLSADLGPRNQELVQFAVDLTRDPSSIDEGDIDKLRSVGWSEQHIHDAILVISFFNYVNRFVEATGIDIEEDRRDLPQQGKGVYG